jgi:hypothetical protein
MSAQEGVDMKRILLPLAFLLATGSAASAQFAPSTENLRGLTGVRLMVMLGGYPHRLDEAQRPELLKMVEAEATAKLQEAGIPVFRLADKRNNEKSGDPRLVITVPMDEPTGSMSLTTEVKLLQKVRLSRDPSIETDAATWSREGSIHAPPPRDSVIRRQIASEIDRFIEDYLSVNPKQPANSTKQKSN